MDHTLEGEAAEGSRQADKQLITGSLQVPKWKEVEGVEGTKEGALNMLIKSVEDKRAQQGKKSASGRDEE